MATIRLETVQWASLPDIDDVDPISDKDREVLEDLRAVMIRHGYTERFGVCLLHKHFDLAEGEVLMETTDPGARVSTLAVERQGARSTPSIETMWKFSADGEVIAGTKCVQQCDYAGGHRRVHSKVAT